MNFSPSHHLTDAPFPSSSALSSEIPRGEENSISPPRVLDSLNTNPQIEGKRDELPREISSHRPRHCLLPVVTDASIPSSPSAIFSGEEGTVSSFPSTDLFPESETATHNPQPEAQTTRRSFLHVMEIIDEQDMGKHLLGLAIPMGVALVLSARALIITTEMYIVAILLSFATALISNGLLLRKTFTKSSTFMLVLGAALMMMSFYSLVGLFLPLSLKWIPVICGLASLIPFAMYSWAYFRRDGKMKDPEKGE